MTSRGAWTLPSPVDTRVSMIPVHRSCGRLNQPAREAAVSCLLLENGQIRKQSLLAQLDTVFAPPHHKLREHVIYLLRWDYYTGSPLGC